mgnify:CR=1 FL=1
MKIILIFSYLFLAFFIPCFADENTPVLKAERGIVKQIDYIDTEDINSEEDPATIQTATVKILTGNEKGQQRIIENRLTGNPAYDIDLSKGSKVILHAEKNDEGTTDFFIADIQRDNAIIGFAAVFCILLLIIGRKKGIFSLVSIVSTVVLIFTMLMPMILSGLCPIASAVLVCIFSTIITIYLVGGLNSKSSSAVFGTILSLILAAGLSLAAIYTASLTGFAGEENMFLFTAHKELNFQGILSASMIIAALGAVMDTAVSIASTINEIYLTDNNLSVKQLFKSGMNVGRDIIGTMSNTLILVYLGSSLPLVLLSSNIDMVKFFNLNQVATEILSAIVGSIAILACVPITAAISAFMIKKFGIRKPIDFNFED